MGYAGSSQSVVLVGSGAVGRTVVVQFEIHRPSDNQVVAGQTYYYVATAVDGSGVESGYSNQVQAVIPKP